MSALRSWATVSRSTVSGSRLTCALMTRCTSAWKRSTCARSLSSRGTSGLQQAQARDRDGARGTEDQGLKAALEPRFELWCTSPMAEEKNRSKDIVLWIITVVLVALAIYWYKK